MLENSTPNLGAELNGSTVAARHSNLHANDLGVTMQLMNGPHDFRSVTLPSAARTSAHTDFGVTSDRNATFAFAHSTADANSHTPVPSSPPESSHPENPGLVDTAVRRFYEATDKYSLQTDELIEGLRQHPELSTVLDFHYGIGSV